jgi:hypothetical protein
LEALVTEAGLRPSHLAEVDTVWSYPDTETALRGLMSSGPVVRAIQYAGEAAVREAVSNALAPFQTAPGGYVLRNKFRFLIATA